MERRFVTRLAYPLENGGTKVGFTPSRRSPQVYISINVRATGRARLYSQRFSHICVHEVVAGGVLNVVVVCIGGVFRVFYVDVCRGIVRLYVLPV